MAGDQEQNFTRSAQDIQASLMFQYISIQLQFNFNISEQTVFSLVLIFSWYARRLEDHRWRVSNWAPQKYEHNFPLKTLETKISEQVYGISLLIPCDHEKVGSHF